MKKKQIEKIPYLGLKAPVGNKKVNYVGVTAVKIIDHERHFFLEMYQNTKSGSAVPVVRIVCTGKDFGTFFPGNGQWSRQKIKTRYGSDGLIWETREKRSGSYREIEEKNVLHSAADLERVKKFFQKEQIRREDCWWERIERRQDSIVCEARMKTETRKYERRQQALKDRIANTPVLPEKEILRWGDEHLFYARHYLYYKKKGRKATLCCSCCGGIKTGAWKSGQSFESMFESRVEEPRENALGECLLCGARGIYKPQGKVKVYHSEMDHVFLADRYKDTGAVIRYVQLEKKWQLEVAPDEKGNEEMVGAYESLEGVEIARTYFEKGKEPQTDYQKHNPYSGKDYWDDCNLYGTSNIQIKEATLYPGFVEKLKGTILQYSGIDLFRTAVGKVNARVYMERYLQTPQIEMLAKLKLCGIVKKLCEYKYGIVDDINADRPDTFLGIRKEKLQLLVQHQGDANILNVLQMEKRMGQKWTDEQILSLCEIGAERRNIERVTSIMTLQKALNQIAKYAGCTFGTGCSSAVGRLKHTATTYFDYLAMREQLGYDLGNTVYQRPRNLDLAHNEMVKELDGKEQDDRIRSAEEKYPLIRKNYRKLRNRYLYEDESYIIRPARSAEEIIQEGRILHHCVGGDGYLGKHNRQESIILLLRFKERPDIPYITVEIRDEKIVQWYGSHDKKPDEKNMQKWLDAYVLRLKCGQLGAGKRADQGEAQQLLANA